MLPAADGFRILAMDIALARSETFSKDDTGIVPLKQRRNTYRECMAFREMLSRCVLSAAGTSE